MKKALPVIIPILFVLGLAFIQDGCMKAPTPEEVKASLELLDVDTKWVKKFYFPWPQKLILSPAISFRVKNLTDKPMRYLYFNAIFKYESMPENLGDRLYPAFQKEPLMPGEVSDTILMACNFGVEGKNLAYFKGNPAWKTADVKLFVRPTGTQYVLFGEWEVSKKIDFKEPEPYRPKKKEKKSPVPKKSFS